VSVQERALARLRRLVEHETPSGDEARITVLIQELRDELASADARCEAIHAPGFGHHLLAFIAGVEPALEPVLVLGHVDTVHPVGTLAERPFRVADGRAWGPGTFDMKAGVAVVLEALAALRADGRRPRRPVELLLTCDEEVGSGTSRALIEERARGAAAVLVPEPPLAGGAAKTARKGVATYQLRITGRAAHAGLEPERGISAITELAHLVLALQALADAGAGTTVAVTVVEGGTRSNVVAAEAVAAVDVRFERLAEFRRVDAAIHGLRPVTAAAVEVMRGDERPPLERTAGVAELYARARAVAAELGWELGEGAAGGGSDGNFTGALGVPTLDGLGVQGDGAHAVHEHVLVADLPRRVAFLRRLLETL
jgi:glutamate carboxypeptidase